MSSRQLKWGNSTTVKAIEQKISAWDVITQFRLSDETQDKLSLVETSEFNIFDLKQDVGEDELVILSTFLMEKHGLF